MTAFWSFRTCCSHFVTSNRSRIKTCSVMNHLSLSLRKQHSQLRSDWILGTKYVSSTWQVSRQYSTLEVKTDTSADLSNTYTYIYKFPYIVHARAFSRLKIAQTVFTVALIPTMGAAVWMNYAPISAFKYSLSVATFACIMLYIISYYLRRLVGIIALNGTGDTIRVSHLNFWGRRQEFYVPVEQVMPIAQYEARADDAYIPFLRYDVKEKYYMSLKWGGILDKEKFVNVFGSIS